MDLQPTDEQRLVIDTFRAFFGKESPPDTVRAADETVGHDPRLWSGFSALGGPLLSLPEAAGGGGGTLLDAALVGLEAGRHLAPIAYADAVVAARTLGRASGLAWDDLPVGEAPVAWGPQWAGQVSATDATPTPNGAVMGGPAGSAGLGEPAAPVGRLAAPAKAERRLTGRLRWTRAGAAAAWLVVDLGAELALVDLAGPGVERRPLPNLGCFPMAEISFHGAPVAGLWPCTQAEGRRVRAEARVLAAAELVGAGRQALELARGHVLEREQFDRPIATFQAIQHRLADRHTALEAAELLVLRAASNGTDDQTGQLAFTSAVALLRAAEAAELAAKEALQFFGGYGFTLEYDVHLYLRYAKTLAVLARDPALVDDALPVAG